LVPANFPIKFFVGLLLVLIYGICWNTTRAEPSAVVINHSTGETIYSHNDERPHSMASITKLMTAMVVLDTRPDVNKIMHLKTAHQGRTDYSLKEMLELLLVRSDNRIAEILSRNFHSNRPSFIAEMNVKAQRLGMSTAHFVDPSGLDAGNQASARDVATMILASATYPEIKESSKRSLEWSTATKKGLRIISLFNTNYKILSEFQNVVVSKTGSTNAAGRCVAMVVEQLGQTYAVVVMGETNGIQRDIKVRYLMNHYLHQ